MSSSNGAVRQVRLGDLFTERREKGVPGLPVMSVTMNGGVVERSSLDRRVTSELSPSQHSLARRHDVAYNMMRMWQGVSGYVDRDCLISPAYVVLIPNDNVDPLFSAYLLKSDAVVRKLHRFSQGLADDRLRLYFDQLRGIPVEIPSKEQQKIGARVLRAVDDAIERTREVIEQTRRLKGALLQDLLTNGLPGRDTEFVQVRLGEVFCPRKEPGLSGLPRVAVTMHDGLVNRDEIERRMETNLSDDQHLLVRCGDIAYNMMRMWQGVFGLAEFDCLVSPAYVVVEPTGGLRSDYAAHLFKLPATIRKFHLFSQGLTEDRLRLYFEQFAPIKVSIPRSVDDQARIVELLATLDHRIASQSDELSQLTEAKSALSQALLTGQVRVPTAEVASA